MGKNEFHRLVRLRDPRGAVEGDALRLYVDFLCSCILFFFCPRRVLRALQIELYLTAANNVLPVLFVLAAMRVDNVVTFAGLSKNRYLDVFQETCRIVLVVRRLRGFHRKEPLGSYVLGKSEPALLSGDTFRRRRWRVF